MQMQIKILAFIIGTLQIWSQSRLISNDTANSGFTDRSDLHQQ